MGSVADHIMLAIPGPGSVNEKLISYFSGGGSGFVRNDGVYQSSAVDKIPLTVKGFSGQTADLQQWQNSVGTRLSSIMSDGRFFANTSISVGAIQVASSAAKFHATPNAATEVGVIVRAAASQTADLTQWQNSAGTVLASITAAGIGRANEFQSTAFGTARRIILNESDSTVFLTGTDAAKIGLKVRGAASQTANLQEWQDSAATMVARIGSLGDIGAPTIANAAWTSPFIDFSTTFARVTNRNTVSNVAWIVQGMASQTGDLQQWRDSASAILARVTSAGGLTASVLTSAGTLGQVRTNSSGNNLEFSRAGASYIYAVDAVGILNIGVVGSLSAIQITSNGTVTVSPPSAGIRPLIVKGFASQTADLQEWQDSAATGLARITSAGRFAATFVEGFRTLELGATDSGGTGFRAVRVAN